jgi:hypothetical protein
MDNEKKGVSYRSGLVEAAIGCVFFYAVIYFLGNRISKNEMWWIFFILPAFVGIVKKHILLRFGLVKSGSNFEFILDTIWGSSMLSCALFYVVNYIR